MDKIVRASVADLLINLSAGWVAAAIATPFLTELSLLGKIGVLLGNISFGIISMYLAIRLRRMKRK